MKYRQSRAILNVLAWLALLGLATPVSAYEEPRYTVEQQYEGFELRRYAPHLVAETDATGDFSSARSEAFRRLFRYITGANRSEAKIEMTVPVATGESGTTIDMTVPVTTANGASSDRTVMQFMVPSQFTRATVPQPTDPRVTIREVPERLMAVRRYSGSANEANYQRELEELRSRIAGAGLTVRGKPLFAVYNGPFTLPFLRRNEVMIEVTPPPRG